MTDAVTIVTTRVRTYDGVLRPLRLDELSERDAFDLLTREHRPDDEQQQAAAHTIVERLGRHALSLDVTRCRVRSSTDYESLLNRLDQRALQTIEQAGRNVGNLAVDHTASITATLADSIEDLSDLGARALDICAHFDAVPNPDDLMTAIVGYVDETEEFDVYPMGWGGTSPYGTSLYSFFHSENAGEDTEKFAYNSTGYGISGGSADKLLSAAYKETDPEKRSKKYAKAMERIYLDMPYMLRDYAKYRWPVNSAKFDGFVENIVDPGYANWDTEYSSIFLKENLKK